MCGVCSAVGHSSDMCPSLQGNNLEQANALGSFQGQQVQQRQKYDPFSNTYNVGWRDHPNFSYLGNQQSVPNANFSHPPGFKRMQQPYQPRPQHMSQNQGTSLEDLVKSLATSSLQFQQEARTTIKNLETQVSQLASTVGKLEAQGSGKLPSQTIVNTRENASFVTLRSGKQLEEVPKRERSAMEQQENLVLEKDEATSPIETISAPKAPTLELKPLPEHLEYVYLGEGDTLPIIIAKNLTTLQKQKLICVLKENKTVIGWTIADIKGISPSMCTHRILIEDEAKPTREAQRRLNPPMMEVVKKEILKWLDVGVIYPISDSKWVSPSRSEEIWHQCG